jgi:hypothetical protein
VMTRMNQPYAGTVLNQALPGMYVDIIRIGLPQRDAQDHRKLWGRAYALP